MIRDFVKTFPKAHADVVRLLNRNRIFMDRTKGIGVLSKEDAINFELLRAGGPGAAWSATCARTSRTSPTANLQARSRWCARKGGDCYARYLVRMERDARVA